MARQADPRYQRVRRALVSAVFELAGRKPAETITVSELAQAAGVSRASFYGHSSSPSALLADALVAELRPALDHLADELGHAGADHPKLWREIYLTCLRHVAEHAGVYRVLVVGDQAAFSALAAYFEEAARSYVEAFAPRLDGPPATRLWVEMAVAQQAADMVAVIKAWLATGMADPPEAVVETYLTLAPPWQLARPDDRGLISLRRSRAPRARGDARPKAQPDDADDARSAEAAP